MENYEAGTLLLRLEPCVDAGYRLARISSGTAMRS
jgi:hypothetical protein